MSEQSRTVADRIAWSTDYAINDNSRDALADEIETALDAAEDEVARMREALVGLRDYFAYAQGPRGGMQVVASPRCAPSVWREIERRVELALKTKR